MRRSSGGPPLTDHWEPSPRTVTVAFSRLPGWVTRYEARHPGTEWRVDEACAWASSDDGSTCSLVIPFSPLGDASMAGLFAHLDRPWQLGVVLVRRGGFAVARLKGDEVVTSKVGQRHVQGRTKAGGWSQQRFARRRDNQARAAYDAAASYVADILLASASALDLLVTGGDKAAVDAVFGERALGPLKQTPLLWLPGLPDPKRSVLDKAVALARSVTITLVDSRAQRL